MISSMPTIMPSELKRKLWGGGDLFSFGRVMIFHFRAKGLVDPPDKKNPIGER